MCKRYSGGLLKLNILALPGDTRKSIADRIPRAFASLNEQFGCKFSAGILPRMTWHDRIRIDPKVLAGKPVVGRTCLAVDFVIGLLGHGWVEEDILKNYPGLTREDIAACIPYAAEALNSAKVYPLTSA